MSSGIPGELNDNWGSNWGLDGFYHEMDMGEGVLSMPNVGKPKNEGKAGLPRGMMITSEFDIPDDVLSDVKFDTDFEEFDLGGESSPHLASVFPKNKPLGDFSWMENAVQDPARLPSEQGLDSLKALEALWGAKTDGVHRIPVKDREDYLRGKLRKPADDDPFNIDKIASKKRVAAVIAEAMRDSARQVPLNQIHQKVVIGSKGDLGAVREPWARLVNDYGLVGNLYVRASAYPGVEHGKWGKEFAKVAKRCRYLVASPNQDVEMLAQMHGLTIVASPAQIPWEMEIEYHRPIFAAQRRQLDDSLPPAEALRKAFLAPNLGPSLRAVEKTSGHQKRQKLPSIKEAQKKLREYKPTKHEIKSLAAKLEERAEKKAMEKLGHWVKANQLSQADLDAISKSGIPAHLVLEKIASSMAVNMSKKASYHGSGEGVLSAQVRRWLNDPSQTKFQDELRDVNQRMMKLARDKLAKDHANLMSKLGTMVRANLISSEDFVALRDGNMSLEETLKRARELAARPVPTREYTGFRNENNRSAQVSEKKVKQALAKEKARNKDNVKKVAEKKRLADLDEKCSTIELAVNQGVRGVKLAKLIKSMIKKEDLPLVQERLNPLLKKSNALETAPAPKKAKYEGKIYHEHVPTKQIAKTAVPEVLKYAGHQMNMGVAGQALDQVLVNKFGGQAVVNAGQQLFQIRKKSEGLAGFHFIDPAVYATDGIKGCEKGAALVKGSKAPHILEMEKCKSCTARNHMNCLKYKKRLVASPMIQGDIETVRENNIKTANMALIPDDDFFTDGHRQLKEAGLTPESTFVFELEPERNNREIIF